MNWFRPLGRAAHRRSSNSERSARRLPPLDLHGAILRKADLSAADLSRANFAGTDFTGANLSGTDLRDANLEGTILRAADLRGARNLTWEQLSQAVVDETTKLPDYLKAKAAQADAR